MSVMLRARTYATASSCALALVTLAAASLVGCGSSKGANSASSANRPENAAVGSSASTRAQVVARAVEPRTMDATAAKPSSGGSGPSTIGTPSDPTDPYSRPQLSAEDQAALVKAAAAGDKTAMQTLLPPQPAVAPGTPTRIGARHVLIQWMGSDKAPSSVVRTREQARALAEEVLRRAKAGEDVARLAVEYSDEPGSSGRGGSLGRFGRGQMVGPFEEAAFKLKVGAVSEIVETPFGFHVIQRTE